MEFRKVGEHTVRCVISEEEIEELGYTIDDLVSNGVRTQELMNCIFGMAEAELDIKFSFGIRSVRADIMPNHTIALTFSDATNTEDVMGHLKDIVDGLMKTFPKEKWDEIKALSDELLEQEAQAEDEEEHKAEENVPEMVQESKSAKKPRDTKRAKEIHGKIIVMFAFEDLDVLIRYAKQVNCDALPFNQLCKLDDAYFLIMDMTDCEEARVKWISSVTDEYAAEVFVGKEKRAYVYEHGKMLIDQNAIETLCLI